MELVIQAAMAIGILAAGAGLLFAAFELRTLRTLLEQGRLRLAVALETEVGGCGCGGFVGNQADSKAGYCIYVWRGGRWHLETDLSAPGYEPTPPTASGSFEHQVLRKPCVPTRA